jgi:hypothetical protein
MDYTASQAFGTHSGTGHRLHQATDAVPTEVSPVDINQLTWAVMAVLAAAGIAPSTFSPDVPASYTDLTAAIKVLGVQAGSPIGTVATGYYTTQAPTGWVLLQGQTLSRIDDAALWAHAQATGALVSEAAWQAGAKGSFSTGDGAATFRVPLLGGQHVRVLDDGAGVDPSRALGSLQGDQVLSHAHSITINLLGESGSGTPAGGASGADGTWNGNTATTGGGENRVKTVALRAIMKRY